MNKVILMGRLTRDPETRYTNTNNIQVTTFALAVNRRVKQGEEKQADYLNIVTYGKTAEFCSKYFLKGQQVAVVGRIQTRNYDRTDGKKVYVTEVVAEETYFADSKKETEEDIHSQLTGVTDVVSGQAPFTPVTDDLDSLPF
jgi:single-strand DNA-binding protein